MDYVFVALGGGLGAIVRYALSQEIVARLHADFPFHTFVINVTGSLAAGFLVTLLTDRTPVDPVWRLFLLVGFLGGYTTFSAYTAEALTLFKVGEPMVAALYILGSNGVGLAAALLGMVLARAAAAASSAI